jgi:hypothetical protein
MAKDFSVSIHLQSESIVTIFSCLDSVPMGKEKLVGNNRTKKKKKKKKKTLIFFLEGWAR